VHPIYSVREGWVTAALADDAKETAAATEKTPAATETPAAKAAPAEHKEGAE
jgi:hypothetical protein